MLIWRELAFVLTQERHIYFCICIISIFLHTYISKPASVCRCVIIYEPENIPLSSENPPGWLSVTFIIPPNAFSQEPPQIPHFDEMTVRAFIFSSRRRLHLGRPNLTLISVASRKTDELIRETRDLMATRARSK